MDNQNQNQSQTPPPNFDFIVNPTGQNGAPAPQEPKKHSKKVVILAVMVVLTVVMLGVGLLLPKSSTQEQTNGQQNQTQTEDQTETPTTENQDQTEVPPAATKEEQLVRDYLKALSEQKYEAAYGYLTSDVVIGPQKVVTKEFFIATIGPAITSAYKTAECTTKTPDALLPTAVETSCKSTDGKTEVVSYYRTETVKGADKIGLITLKETKTL